MSFIVLVLVQVLVLNHIHLFDCATPLIYVYLAIPMRRDYPRWGVLLWCFSIGLCIDIFSNTPGVAAASMTLIGLLQPYLLSMFILRDSPDDLLPTYKTLGVTKYIFYVLMIVIVYCLAFFTIEVFNFYNSLQWAECVGGSIIVTSILILALENLVKRR